MARRGANLDHVLDRLDDEAVRGDIEVRQVGASGTPILHQVLELAHELADVLEGAVHLATRTADRYR